MEALPLEIVDQILDDMYGPIASAAFISPVWKKAVEARTFPNVTVNSRKLDLFKSAFLDRSRRSNALHRRDIVQNITFCVELWSYHGSRRNVGETDKEREENNKHLTWAVSSFLRTMSAWKKGDVALRIEVYSPTDWEHRSWQIFGEWVPRRTDGHLLQFVRVDSFFKGIQPVRCVTEFGKFEGRGVHPASISKIWKYMTNIKSINSNLAQSDNRHKKDKEQERTDFGLSLATIPFTNLTELSLDYSNDRIGDHDFKPGSGETIEVDRLCLAINKICQNAPVRKLKLEYGFIVSQELFSRPKSGVMWPKIETVDISMSSLTPKGGWYTTGADTRFWRARFNAYGNPNRLRRLQNGEVPFKPWRDSADSKEFDPLMLSVAEALLCMKGLKRFHLGSHWFSLDFQDNCLDGGNNHLEFINHGRDTWGPPVELRILWSLVVKEDDGGEIKYLHNSKYGSRDDEA